MRFKSNFLLKARLPWSLTLLLTAVLGVLFFTTRDESTSHKALVELPEATQQRIEPLTPITAPDAGAAPDTRAAALAAERPAFAAFADWMTRYQQVPASPALVQEGVSLARERATAMKALIQSDPSAALGLALSATAQSPLPAEVRALLEQAVHGQGRLNVDGVVPLPGGTLPERSVIRSIVTPTSAGAQENAREYSAYVYGRRLHELSATSTEFEGVVLENQLAVYDHGDFPAHGSVCLQCKGGSGYGVNSAALGDSTAGSADVAGRPALSWSTGVKKVLIIRVDFSDLSGDPVSVPGGPPLTKSLAEALFTQPDGIDDFFYENSYGKTTLLATATTDVYRMPQTALYYAQGDGTQSYSGQIRDAARDAAAANYDLSTYDRIGVVCSSLTSLPGSKTGFAGVANIGGANFLINGVFNFSTVTHELGHTYGVYHANWWKPANNAIIGTERELFNSLTNGENTFISLEYQDNYDIMGAFNGVGPAQTLHLNHWFKNLLGWIPDTAVQSINTPGTYRIYRFDDGLANPATRSLALKIGRDERRDFWVGFRRQAGAGTNVSTGAYILFGYNYNAASDLLVCNNPGVNVNSAALQVGQTLTDAAAGITITTVALGGTAPDEYLDIAIAFQPRASFTRRLFAIETTTSTTTASITVERTGGSTGATSVSYSTADDIALAGTHYTASSGTLTWADGDTSPRVINIPVIAPYAASQGAKAFTVQLIGAAVGITGTTTVSLRPPGNPDPAQDLGRVNDGIRSMALQADGKLLVAGTFILVGDRAVTGGPSWLTTPAGYIARFNPDGTLDTTFDTSAGASGHVSVIRVQNDGKILVGGNFQNVNNASPARPLVARLNSDGSLDSSFATPDLNLVLSPTLTIGGEVNDIALQADGKIVLAGPFYAVNGTSAKGLCRLHPDGTPDYIFNPAGLSTSAGMAAIAFGQYDATLGGPRLYAAGPLATYYSTSLRAGIICIRPDGTTDPSFQVGDGTLAALGGSVSLENRAVAVQADGKILLGGNFGAFNTSAKPNIVRLNPNGSVDESFTAPSFGSSSVVLIFSLLVQPDGKVLVGGMFDTVGGLPHRSLIRLTSTGAIDPDWDNGTGEANGSLMAITSFLPKPDGRVLAAANSVSLFRGVLSNYQSLFTGLPSTYGTGRFRLADHGVQPGNTVQIAVQRVNGGTGAVQLDYGTQPGTGQPGIDYVSTAGTISWPDGDTTPKTILVQCLPGATTGRTFRLNLVTPNGGLLLGSIRSTSVTIGGTTNFEAWRTQHFNAAQQADEALTGPAASFANDGTPNLLKYALGLAPATRLNSAVDSPTTLATDRLQLAFTRDPTKTDLIYEVQGSSNLVTWTPLARSIAGATTSNLGAFALGETTQGALFRVTVTDSVQVGTATNRRFLRLKVTK